MPKVGSKHYSYSPEGIAMAKAAAKKKGVKVQYGNKKNKKKSK
jgi:aspartyl aminopeptidase